MRGNNQRGVGEEAGRRYTTVWLPLCLLRPDGSPENIPVRVEWPDAVPDGADWVPRMPGVQVRVHHYTVPFGEFIVGWMQHIRRGPDSLRAFGDSVLPPSRSVTIGHWEYEDRRVDGEDLRQVACSLQFICLDLSVDAANELGTRSLLRSLPPPGHAQQLAIIDALRTALGPSGSDIRVAMNVWVGLDRACQAMVTTGYQVRLDQCLRSARRKEPEGAKFAAVLTRHEARTGGIEPSEFRISVWASDPDRGYDDGHLAGLCVFPALPDFDNEQLFENLLSWLERGRVDHVDVDRRNFPMGPPYTEGDEENTEAFGPALGWLGYCETAEED